MITAILTVYKRPHTLLEQIQAIKNQTVVPTQIMVWVNGDVELPKIDEPDIIVSRCNTNLKFHARFAFGLLAKTKYVAFFDDDSIPGNRWFENCLNSHKVQPGIYGSTGVILKGNAYLPSTKVGWNSLKSNNIERVDLVGHSWFMKRDTLKYLWMEEPASWDNAEDIQLSYLAQKYGGINTFVPPHPENDQTLWGSMWDQGNKYGTDENATFKTQNNHLHIRNSVCTKFIREGWKLTRHGK
jgi:GT2 family glycosyltransferase